MSIFALELEQIGILDAMGGYLYLEKISKNDQFVRHSLPMLYINHHHRSRHAAENVSVICIVIQYCYHH